MIKKTIASLHATHDRGDLTVMSLPGPEWQGVRQCPFEPRRIFWIAGMPQLGKRGGHAHWKGEQFMFCPTGGVQISYQCREGKGMVILNHPEETLYVPAMHWLDIRNLHPKTVLVVLASNEYDTKDYIYDRVTFEQNIK